MQGEHEQHAHNDEQEDFYRPQGGKDFAGDASPSNTKPAHPFYPGQVVEWQASEYIHNSKSALWFVGLMLVALTIIIAAIWFGQWTFAVLAVLMAAALGVYAVRAPRDMHYRLSDDGLQIGEKTYAFDTFRSFGVMAEGAFYSIQLIPTKRFMPAITIYFAPDDGERIVDMLASYMPMQQLPPDIFEALMRRLRF